ncbi:(2Fe-2S)-binding protein [Corynebacterium sp. sy017]|nr:(2Fe-2S)-binding protein [Corynebacterium sp. sy017]TSD91301.1 (2Fe-2S)-binding protein [Corynebacterium sp. SY003]
MGNRATRSMTQNLAQELDRLVLDYPRFSPCLVVSESSQIISAQQLLSSEALADIATACADIFHLEQLKHQLHLWLYTFLNDVLSPALYVMIRSETIPAIDFSDDAHSAALLFRRDAQGFWFGLRPQAQARDYEDMGMGIARSFAPIIAKICEHSGMRPAPLWALVADAVVQSSIASANEELETAKALRAIPQILAGIQRHSAWPLPTPRFAELIDDTIVELAETHDVAAAPDVLVAHRSSCCMIYHSPEIAKCVSCPHQEKQQRYARIIAAYEY